MEPEKTMPIEHPIGETTVIARVSAVDGEVTSAAILRTARKLMDGHVFAEESLHMDDDYLPFHPAPNRPDYVPPAARSMRIAMFLARVTCSHGILRANIRLAMPPKSSCSHCAIIWGFHGM